jgi:carbon-monoxide dehydrogenase large subunit
VPEDTVHPDGIGASARRREDQRFVTGRGQFVSDIVIEGELHCAFVRSPHAHARPRSIDLRAALAEPGVVFNPRTPTNRTGSPP